MTSFLVLGVIIILLGGANLVATWVLRIDLRAHHVFERKRELIVAAAAYAEQQAHHHKKVNGVDVTWQHKQDEATAFARLHADDYGVVWSAAKTPDWFLRELRAHLGQRDR